MAVTATYPPDAAVTALAQPPAHHWIANLGHVVVTLRLSSYPDGQPCLDMLVGESPDEELTIHVPGFDLRAYDADYDMSRLHAVFRCPGRAALFAGAGIVNLSPHSFNFPSGSPALQVVWLPTPKPWTAIRKETMHRV